MAQHHGLVAPGLGADDPAAIDNRVAAFGSVGSANMGVGIRHALGDELAVIGGLMFSEAEYGGASGGARMDMTLTLSGALRWVSADNTSIRRFAEAGGWIAPDADVEFSRTYMNGAGTATGLSSPDTSMSYLYLRGGGVIDVAAETQVYAGVEFGREQLKTDAFVEVLSNANPFEASMGAAQDELTLGKIFAGVKHSVSPDVRFSMRAGVVSVLDSDTSLSISVPGIGTLAPRGVSDMTWTEYGASLSYRVMQDAWLGVYVDGVSGNGDRIGSENHVGVRLSAGY